MAVASFSPASAGVQGGQGACDPSHLSFKGWHSQGDEGSLWAVTTLPAKSLRLGQASAPRGGPPSVAHAPLAPSGAQPNPFSTELGRKGPSSGPEGLEWGDRFCFPSSSSSGHRGRRGRQLGANSIRRREAGRREQAACKLAGIRTLENGGLKRRKVEGSTPGHTPGSVRKRPQR